MEFKDCFGRVLVPGDFVMYAKTHGRSAALGFGRVERITEHEDWRGEKSSKLSVLSVQLSFNHKVRKVSTVSLQYQERVVKISESDVPDEWLAVLDPETKCKDCNGEGKQRWQAQEHIDHYGEFYECWRCRGTGLMNPKAAKKNKSKK